VNSWNRGDVVLDTAVRDARRVVGLYGDPTVAWSIVVRLRLARPLDEATVRSRWQEMAAAHAGVGRVGAVETATDSDAGDLVTGFSDLPYGDREPLLRVGMSSDGEVLLVAAHHGAMDGLGLLGAAGRLAGVDLATNASGVASDADATNFWVASLRRLVEAFVRPPQRLFSRRARRGAGDVLTSHDLGPSRGGSAVLLLAAARAVRLWNARGPRRARKGRLIVAMGLSRRPGTPMPPPDRDTAYVRLDAHRIDDLATSRDVLAATRPEPAFPQTEGFGIGPLVTKLLSNRLGSSVLVSNLGVVDTPDVTSIEFWPVPTGPAGVAVGLATTSTTSTITVRARRPWFDADDVERLGGLIADEFRAAAGQ
jgi:hypothetical protein